MLHITFPKEWKHADINQLFNPYGKNVLYCVQLIIQFNLWNIQDATFNKGVLLLYFIYFFIIWRYCYRNKVWIEARCVRQATHARVCIYKDIITFPLMLYRGWAHYVVNGYIRLHCPVQTRKCRRNNECFVQRNCLYNTNICESSSYFKCEWYLFWGS